MNFTTLICIVEYLYFIIVKYCYYKKTKDTKRVLKRYIFSLSMVCKCSLFWTKQSLMAELISKLSILQPIKI